MLSVPRKVVLYPQSEDGLGRAHARKVVLTSLGAAAKAAISLARSSRGCELHRRQRMRERFEMRGCFRAAALRSTISACVGLPRLYSALGPRSSNNGRHVDLAINFRHIDS